MLDYEYKKLHDKSLKRSWPFTIISAGLFCLFTFGIFYMLKYVENDGLIIFVVIIPTALVALIFLLSAINGRKKVFMEAAEAIMYLALLWR